MKDTITIDDFLKLDIRIGEVVSSEAIPNADKLLRLELDFGDHKRQILAGIAEYIDNPRDLVGRKVPVLINLQPRKMRGLVSEGMMLAADLDGKPVILHPSEDVPPGTIIC